MASGRPTLSSHAPASLRPRRSRNARRRAGRRGRTRPSRRHLGLDHPVRTRLPAPGLRRRNDRSARAERHRGSAYGRIAVTYVEWAANTGVVVPWMVIDGPESAARFADALTLNPGSAFGRNAIGRALLDGKALIETNDHEGWRKVIDFSGDSANSYSGPAVEAARDEVVAAGIVINALAISTAERPYLPQAYRDRIIGGPGAFVVEAEGRSDFADAVRRKLILEIGGLTPGTTYAAR